MLAVHVTTQGQLLLFNQALAFAKKVAGSTMLLAVSSVKLLGDFGLLSFITLSARVSVQLQGVFLVPIIAECSHNYGFLVSLKPYARAT